MRKSLLYGGVLVVVVGLAIGGAYLVYRLGVLRSTSTTRGETLSTNDPTIPSRIHAARPQASWPFFRYDAARDGVNPGATARPPFHVRWRVNAGYLEAPAVLGDGVIVYGSYSGRFGSDLYARNADSKRLVWHWHFANGSNFSASPAIYQGRVYVTSHDGNLRAYGLRSGRLLLRVKIPPSESPPIAVANRVYFGDGPVGGDGTFRAVDTRTGRVVWAYKAAGKISSGAALTTTTLYFDSYGGDIYALNRFTGRVRWKTSVTGALGGQVSFYSTPALAGDNLIVGGLDGSVYDFDQRTGALRWRHSLGGYVYGSAAIWRGRIYIGDFSGRFHALSLSSGRELWSRSTGPVIGSPSVVAGDVYTSSLRPARTYAFDARTGATRWTFGDGQFSSVIADGRQLWLTGKGTVYALAEGAP
jgi:outer membrane protein assembly factor BamB